MDLSLLGIHEYLTVVEVNVVGLGQTTSDPRIVLIAEFEAPLESRHFAGDSFYLRCQQLAVGSDFIRIFELISD